MASEDPGTETTPSTDPELRAVQLEKLTAERDTAVAVAREAAAKADAASTPAPASKAPEGTIEVGDKVGLVADLLAHSLLDDAAQQIATELVAPKDAADSKLLKPDSRVLVVESADLVGSDWPYRAIGEQLNEQKAALDTVKGDLAEAAGAPAGKGIEVEVATVAAAAAGLTAVTTLVGSVADLVSMFRSDYKITAREVTIGTIPLVAALSHRLIDATAAINLDKFVLLEESELLAEFSAVATTRQEVQRLAGQLEQKVVAPADRGLEKAKEARGSYAAVLGLAAATAEARAAAKALLVEREADVKEDDEIAEARALVAYAKALVERFDAFAATVSKAPDGGGHPPLVAAAIRERLHAGDGRYTHVLFAAIESAGGETLTRRSLFGSTVRFIGGAQVSYLLWNVAEKRLVAANTAPVLGEMKLDLADGVSDPVHKIALRRC